MPKNGFPYSFIFRLFHTFKFIDLTVQQYVRVGTVTKDELQGSHQDGFTRPGFAGDDVHSFGEVDHDLINDDIILILQLFQHSFRLDVKFSLYQERGKVFY